MAMNERFTRYGCLAFLTVQNSALILTLRYSRTQPGPKYLTSTAVLLSEVFKCLLSLGIYGLLGIKQRKNPRREKSHQRGGSIVIEDDESPTTSSFPPLIPTSDKEISAFLPTLVPAFLYMVQNNLQFIAISHLDAATFQVAYQGKILTTAICAVIFLGKRLSRLQILSVCLLTFGVTCASIPPSNALDHAVAALSGQSHGIGILAAGAACVLSGFAGVYTELILKATQRRKLPDGLDTHMMLWYRNFQLSMASIVFALPGAFIVDRRALLEYGFLFGYNEIVWVTILQQVLGGIIVSFVLTYADNILKGFATSLSVVLSTIVSIVLWKSKLSNLFLVGMVAVLSAAPIYGYAQHTAATPKIQEAEKSLLEDVDTYDVA